MHIIHDENGGVCAHSHGHEHSPESCGNGCGGCQGHAHGHSHEHPHEHTEAQGDRMTALLDYMLQHNEHHAAELDQVAEKFRAEGKADVAEQIRRAADEFQKGNLYLKLALSMVKG